MSKYAAILATCILQPLVFETQGVTDSAALDLNIVCGRYSS